MYLKYDAIKKENAYICGGLCESVCVRVWTDTEKYLSDSQH